MIERLIAEAEGAEPARADRARPRVATQAPSAPRSRRPPQARSTAAALQPQPFAPDRMAAAKAVETALGGAGQETPASSGSPTASTTTSRRALCRAARRSSRGRQLAVVEQQPGQEPLGTVGAASAATASSKPRCCARRRPARAASLHAMFGARRSGWARRRSSSTPGETRALHASICRWSCAIR